MAGGSLSLKGDRGESERVQPTHQGRDRERMEIRFKLILYLIQYSV